MTNKIHKVFVSIKTIWKPENFLQNWILTRQEGHIMRLQATCILTSVQVSDLLIISDDNR